MKLIVGLGNPGASYQGHRHNIGFMALDRFAADHGFEPWRKKFQGQASQGSIDGEKVLLLKPETYMNESGRAVGDALRFLKLGLGDLVVLHDELDLAPGKVRVKNGGGNAGHNGLKSISQHLGNDYVRVRLGIGHPGHKDLVSGYVLHDFSKAERVWLDPLLDALTRAAPLLVKGTHERFMSDVARLTGESAAPSEAPAPQPKPAAPKPSSPRAHPAGERAAKQANALAENLAKWKAALGPKPPKGDV
jgi:peptidyl-tRNA hydrolase, PTH1 family